MSVMPFCMGCGRTGVVTFGSLCHSCIAKDEEADQ